MARRKSVIPVLVKRAYAEYLFGSGLLKKTVEFKLYWLDELLEFLRDKDLREVCKEDLEAYFSHLNTRTTQRSGEPLSLATKKVLWRNMKFFFSFLYKTGRIITNPAQDLKVKWENQEKKKVFLSPEEVEKFLLGIENFRNRVLFELIYGSGLRSGEVVSIKVKEVDLTDGVVWIRKGKWQKDRVVPLSQISQKLLKVYLQGHSKEDYLFTGTIGQALNRSTVNYLFKKEAKNTGIFRDGLSVHSLRHSVASHLLENGADIRFVGELLGHETLDTTVIYTHKNEWQLKKTYRTYHPRENEYFEEVSPGYKEKLVRMRKEVLAQRKALR